MSISGYFSSNARALPADRKDRGPVKETDKRYPSIHHYDPVLRSHCRLDEPPPNPAPDYWLRALDLFLEPAPPKTRP